MGTQGDGCAPTAKTSQSSYIRVLVENQLSTILIDTGASHSFISKFIFETHFQKYSHLFIPERKSITVANNASMDSNGYVNMKITIGSITTTAKLWVLENLCTGIILGLDWLSSDTYRANIDFENNSLSICFNNKRSSTPLLKINSNQTYRVRTCNKFILNSMEEKIIEVKVIDLPNHDTVQFTPTPRFLHEDSILMPHALIKVKHYKSLMTITNLSKKPRIINHNTLIGTNEIESTISSCLSISSPSSVAQ